MSNLLIIYGFREPTNIMIEDFFYEAESKYDADLSVKSKSNVDVKNEDLEWSDIVLAVRPQGVLTAELMRIAKKSGRFTMCLIDDNFFDIKDFFVRFELGISNIISAVKLSDVVISTSDKIISRASRYSKRFRKVYINTAIDKDRIHNKNIVDSQIIKIVYYSNSNDTRSFDELIKPALDDLYDKSTKNIEWYFYNVHPDLSSTEYKDSVTYYDRKPIEEFRIDLASGDYDIGLMPMIDNEFNRGKYVNHFFEYSMAGIPGVYSNLPPYENFITDGVDGVLSDEGGWLEAILRMESDDLRSKLLNGVNSRLLNEFTIEKVYDELLKSIPELHEFHSDNKIDSIYWQECNHNCALYEKKYDRVIKFGCYITSIKRRIGLGN